MTDQENPTLQHNQRERLAKEREERKAQAVVGEQWLEIVKDGHKNGGKVLLCQRMQELKKDGKIVRKGNVHRTPVGREKICTDYLKKMNREGIKVK